MCTTVHILFSLGIIMEIRETIAAIATGVGNGGISIVRISGDDAIDIADRIFVAKNKKKLADSPSHMAHYGHIVSDGNIIDEVLVLVMKAPNTYTKENIVEIDCHGGNFVTRKILDLVLQSGARSAEPGEFTKRAFLNGRIDLAEAESVIDIINSSNEYALKSSVQILGGKLSELIKSMRETIIYNIAYIESALDDPEHISLDNFGDNFKITVDNLLKDVDKLLNSVDNGRILTEGVRTVILGKPNAGKSSLLNVLVGEERAIVTEIAGTTRDVLTEEIHLNGITLKLIDTAGIRKTEDVVEKIGVNKAKEFAKDADLIIYVCDGSTGLDSNDEEILNLVKDKNTIVVINKSDLNTCVNESDIKKYLSCPVIGISAKEETGIDELGKCITNMFIKGDIDYNNQILITRARQKDALYNVKKSLILVNESIENQMPEDFYTIDLTSAYEELGKIIGESVEDDLVNEIFSKFCMGK